MKHTINYLVMDKIKSYVYDTQEAHMLHFNYDTIFFTK
jgi:hypothetical protein